MATRLSRRPIPEPDSKRRHGSGFFDHEIYGLVIRSPEPIPAPSVAARPPDVEIFESSDPLTQDHLPHQNSPFSYRRFDDGAAFVEWMDAIQFSVSADSRRITFFASDYADRRLVFDFLIAHVLSVTLLQRGIESLHATAIEVAGRAIAFIGDCGYGKSTLAAACLRAGARLLTDDLLVVVPEGDTFRVLPGAQRIKLKPLFAKETIGEREGVPMDDARGKFVYPLTDSEFCNSPVPLDRILALRPDSVAHAVTLLVQADGFREIIQATFNPLDTSPQRLRRHLVFTGTLAGAVPVWSASVPWDAATLHETARVVMRGEK